MGIIKHLKKYLKNKQKTKTVHKLVTLLKNNHFIISELKIQNEELLVLYFDTNVHTYELIQDTVNYICDVLPLHTFVALPNNISLQKCDKQFIEHYINLLQQCLLQLENQQ